MGRKKKQDKSKEIKEIMGVIDELQEDLTIPKNVKLKLQKVTNVLKENSELSIKINKALNELDEIGDDVNMQPYTRTQIWNIVSMLEKL